MVETMITAFPHFVERITEYDQSLSAGVQELGFAIAKTFPELVKFATPDSFWNKFRNKASEKASRASTSGKGRKRTKKNEGSSDESSEEDVSDDDLVL